MFGDCDYGLFYGGVGGAAQVPFLITLLQCIHLLLLHLLTFILIGNNNHYHLCSRQHVEQLNTSSLSLQSPGGIVFWAAFFSWFGKLNLEALSLLRFSVGLGS